MKRAERLRAVQLLLRRCTRKSSGTYTIVPMAPSVDGSIRRLNGIFPRRDRAAKISSIHFRTVGELFRSHTPCASYASAKACHGRGSSGNSSTASSASVSATSPKLPSAAFPSARISKHRSRRDASRRAVGVRVGRPRSYHHQVGMTRGGRGEMLSGGGQSEMVHGGR